MKQFWNALALTVGLLFAAPVAAHAQIYDGPDGTAGPGHGYCRQNIAGVVRTQKGPCQQGGATAAVRGWGAIAASATGGALTLPIPSNAQPNDLAVMCVFSGSGWTVATGWTRVYAAGTGGSGDQQSNCDWKVLTSGDISTGSVTIPTNSFHFVGQMIAFVGPDLIRNISGTTITSATTSASVSSTASVAGDVVVGMGFVYNISSIPSASGVGSVQTTFSGTTPSTNAGALYLNIPATSGTNAASWSWSSSGVGLFATFVIKCATC